MYDGIRQKPEAVPKKESWDDKGWGSLKGNSISASSAAILSGVNTNLKPVSMTKFPQGGYDPNNKYNHYAYFTSVAMQIFDAAKAKGATDVGALFIVSQVGFETGYAQSAIDSGDYNLFNIKTTNPKDSKRKATDGGYFKDYSDEGGYTASIQDYFSKIETEHGGWTGMQLIKQSTITADDIDKTFNTGEYFPTEEERHKGQYSYGGKTKESVKDYGTKAYATMETSLRLFKAALDYYVSDNAHKKILLQKSILSRVANGNYDNLTKDEKDQLSRDAQEYKELYLNEIKMVKYKNMIDAISLK